MDIRGLVLVNTRGDEAPLSFASPPLPLMDVAGRSPLLRIVKRMESFGISPVTAVIEESLPSFHRPRLLPPEIECRAAAPERFWRAAENAFNDLAQSGAELVLLVRMGGYAEIDFEKLIQFHLERRGRVSRAEHETGILDVFCLSAFRRNDAASLLRSGLNRCRSECDSFLDQGYHNGLSDARDLRQLAIDVLTLKTESRPAGKEIRPGVWLGSSVRLEKHSRILAPAFIGASTTVRDAAVITRCSAIEHHAHIDCGTVVENCTVLPYTSIGAGLDLAHSVAGMGRIVNLRRGIAVEVVDPHLLCEVSEHITERLAGAAAEWPRRIWRGLFGEAGQGESSTQPALDSRSKIRPESAPEHSGELATNLAIARRYGDQ